MKFVFKQEGQEDIIIDENSELSKFTVAQMSIMYTQMVGTETTFKQRAVGEKMIKAALNQPETAPVKDQETAPKKKSSAKKGANSNLSLIHI